MVINSISLKTKYATYIESLTDETTPNSDHDEHAHHDELEIYNFIEGNLFFSFEGERIPIQNGDIVIIANGSLHKTIIKSPCRYFRKRILVNNSFFASMPDGATELQIRFLRKRIIKINKITAEEYGLIAALRDVEEGIKKDCPFDFFCAMTALATFLIRADQINEEQNPPERFIGSSARDIVEYIDKNISSDLNYKSISGFFHFSEKNLYKIFKNETGFSLSRYIRIRRLIKAKSLLNSGATPAQAAEKSGFSNYSVFYRCFVKEMGVSPTRYKTK